MLTGFVVLSNNIAIGADNAARRRGLIDQEPIAYRAST
jgi:hypothetical protein